MNGVKPTKPTQAVISDPENIPEGIVVGAKDNVKDDDGVDKTVLSIVTDGTDKVFKVECNETTSGQVYTYFTVGMQFEPGEIYHISYKIKPLTDSAGNAFENTIIGGSLRFGTTEAGSFKDHPFDNNSNKSSSDGWIEVTFITRIPANYSASDSDEFQIWGKFSSTSGLGISYLVKDVSISLAE